MSISEDYFKLITAIGSRNLLISMTTTPHQTMENVIISAHFFPCFLFFQLGMFFHLYKTYNVMQNRLARKLTYLLI